MKKIFYILLASLVLFFSCDPHNPENNLTINFDNDTLNKILSKSSARFADPKDDYPVCLYAVLKGSNGTKYEKSMYFQDENGFQLFDNGASITFDLSRVSFRENYDLYVYVVQQGECNISGKMENIELNKYGPTYLNVKLTYSQALFDPPLINIMPTQYNTSGNFVLLETEDTGSKNRLGYFNNANTAEIEISLSQVEANFSYEMYVIHDGKETTIPLNFYDSNDSINYYYYTITSPGEYIIACRKTDSSGCVFKTTYKYLEYKSNQINTDFMIYSNGTSFKAAYSPTLTDEGNLSAPNMYTTAQISSTWSTSFDFCYDNEMNYYINDGNNIFKNGDYITPYINPNTYDITSKKINCDFNSGVFTIVGEKNYNQGFGFYKEYFYNLNSWFSSPEQSYMYTLINAIFHANKVYVFYTYYSQGIITLLIEEYEIFENKPGVLTLSDTPVKYRIFTKPYDGNFDIPSVHVNDVIVLNNQIYFTVSVENLTPFSYCTNAVGFIGKFSLSDKSVKIIGYNPSDITNNTETDNSYQNKNYYSSSNYTDYVSKADELNSYCSIPRHFIAIKPKKLIISDDGYVFWSDNEGNKYRNSNRVITVDLETFGITDVSKLNNLKWLFDNTYDIEASGEYIYFSN